MTTASLNEPTGKVMNTTMDKDSFSDKPTGGVMNTMDKDYFGTSVQGVQRGKIPGTQAHTAGLWWTNVDCAVRSYVHDCGG